MNENTKLKHTVNWYGIDGITHHPDSTTGTFDITYNGVRDDVGMVVEDMMDDDYTTYLDDASLDLMPDETCTFEEYMHTNSRTVMRCINLVREDRRT